MATRSHVGYIDFDGKLKAAYCHWENRDLRFIEEARHYLQEGKNVYYTSWW